MTCMRNPVARFQVLKWPWRAPLDGVFEVSALGAPLLECIGVRGLGALQR